MIDNSKTFVSTLTLGVIFAGCAAVGVPATSDPAKKIGYAYMLFDQQQRPIPAERLIREAITIYQENNNELGLAEAYRAYGFFYRSPAVEKYQKKYETNGFYEEGATYVNRHEKSIEYFEKSAAILEKHHKNASLTNIYLNMGLTYQAANQPGKACDKYKKSLASHKLHSRENPDVTVTLPKGWKSYEAYMTHRMESLKCTN